MLIPKYEYFFLFKFQNEYIVYDYYNAVIFEITGRMYDFLLNYRDHIDNSQYGSEQAAFEYLIKQGYLLSDNALDQDYEEDAAYLSFAPSHQCNLRCKYCFAKYGMNYEGDAREYTSESLRYMLDYFFNQAFPNRQKYRINFYSGGEPLIRFDIIKQTVEYCEDLMAKKHIQIMVWLCTNGILLTDEICGYMDEHKMTIGISIDGPKELHDKNRIDAYGNGTYDRVIKNIYHIQHNQRLSSRFKNIWGLCVFSDTSTHLVDIIEHHRDLGFNDVQIKLERKILPDNFDYSNYKEEYLSLMKKMINEAKNGNISAIRMILNNEDYLGKFILRIITNQYITLRCNAGKCKIAICPNGDIYPCDSFIGIPEMKIGNMYWDTPISKTFGNLTVNNCEPCSTCSLRYLCGGDCYYNSYINTHSLSTVHPQMCDMLKYLCELAIWGVYHLQKDAQEAFERLQIEILRVEKIRHQI